MLTMRKSNDDQINAALAGLNHEVDIVTVDNPLALVRDENLKREAIRTLRDDTLAALHARQAIDDAMFYAGRLLQKCYDNSQIGSVCAIDPSKEAVDGGRFPEPLSERQIKASSELASIRKQFKWEEWHMLDGIVCQGKTIQNYGMSLGMTTGREFDWVSRQFKQYLNKLAKICHFA